VPQSHPAADPEALLAHSDFVRGVARSLLFDEHAADDVVQQTWLAALGADAPASRGWLGAVARNLAIKRLRGDRRRVAREAAVARHEGVPSDDDVRERERLRRDVVDAVLALAEPYRGTILLRYFEGLPPRDVATRMGVPVETVRTRTRRAVEILRTRLDARHARDRGAFCAALAAWAGARDSGGAATAAGGAIVGTKAVVAATGVVVALVAWLLWPTSDGSEPSAPLANSTAAQPGNSTSSAREPRSRATEAAAAAERPGEQSSPPQGSTPRPVRGRIVDGDGRPAAGVRVLVAVGGEPKVIEPVDNNQGPNSVSIGTDDEGRFAMTIGGPAKCTVTVLRSPAFEPRTEASREVPLPAEGLEFVVDRRPTATLVVTAFDLDEAKAVADFTCGFGGHDVRTQPQRSVDGKVAAEVRLASAAGDTVKVTVDARGVTASRDVAVRENERVEVRVELRRNDAVAGRVVDASGAPLANALVFFGEEDVARGDEPFKPFDEKRVKDGVRTGADGRFELRGKGRWITVWHPEASLVTLPVARAADVVLPARGGIRGVLRGADGAPLAETKVFLDRVRETTTDAEGRFAFDKVEAGTRGLSLTGGKPKGYVAVRVTPGETADVEMRPGLASVRITWPGRTSFGRFVGLLPLGVTGSLAIGQPTDGAIVAADVLPGRYLLMLDGGAIATVDVAGPETTAVVGTGEVVVRAKPKTRVYVVPADSGYLARLMGGRMAGAGVPADGVQHFTGLAPGRYEIGVERDGVRTVVDVRDGAVEVAIEEP
jgi:RNA polymerase sigma-70 factor (ECF subfamily)